jgi:hypothetical protein
MRRALIIALAMTVIGSMLFGLYKWDKEYRFYRLSWWNKIHYILNKLAYERLGEQLEDDPLIWSVYYAPHIPLDPVWVPPFREKPANATPEELQAFEDWDREAYEQQERYEPILKGLRFPGVVAFDFDPTLPNVHYASGGGGSFGTIDRSVKLLHVTGATNIPTQCPKRPLRQPTGDCLRHLGDTWWLRYEWSSDQRLNKS